MKERTVIAPLPSQLRSEKQMYPDVLRAWSVLGVLMCHVALYYSEQAPTEIGFILSNAVNSLMRTAIQCFLMISGALLLDEKYHYTDQKLKKMRITNFH